ncbi:hypothetical protein [Fulvivirga lutea]|uniref:Uncharacterized protein n=1 Tax=Fulvivirga lutea TaxID=2810512 RepID=A0A974WK89_9BACT|nr:hypothetical protein [Fulvivirga lutea]QSE98702.1 hypothetical protein JR347_06375 [Fulvivirga lutea]
MKITPKQKKSFQENLTAKNIKWGEFGVVTISENDDHQEYQRLVHNPTELFFGFYHNEIFQSLYPDIGGWYVEYSPGSNNTPIASHPTVKNWEAVMELFDTWSELLKLEIEAYDFLDKLKEFSRSQSEINNLPTDAEQQFEPSEEIFIKEQLDHFSEKVSKLNLLPEQLSEINLKLDYLNSRIDKKYPRVDWLNIFVGTIISTLSGVGMENLKDPSVIEHLKILFHTITAGRFLK